MSLRQNAFSDQLVKEKFWLLLFGSTRKNFGSTRKNPHTINSLNFESLLLNGKIEICFLVIPLKFASFFMRLDATQTLTIA